MNLQEHPTSNVQRPTSKDALRRSMLDVGCWMFSIGSRVQCAKFLLRGILTPGPLPQERENRRLSLCEANRHGFRMPEERTFRNAATAKTTDEFSMAAPLLSLSPGERVGVRASVHTNIHWPFAFRHKAIQIRHITSAATRQLAECSHVQYVNVIAINPL